MIINYIKVNLVKQFAGTVHVETVVLLSQLKQKPDDYINVTIELDDVDITSAETKATYDEIKKYVSEHNAGMKVSNLYISQVKRKCGIEVGKNLRVATRRMDCLQGNSTTARQTWNLFQVLIYLKMKTVGNHSVRKIKREQLWRHWSILR